MATEHNEKMGPAGETEEDKHGAAGEMKPSALNPKAVPFKFKGKDKSAAAPAAPATNGKIPPKLNADVKPFVPKSKPDTKKMPSPGTGEAPQPLPEDLKTGEYPEPYQCGQYFDGPPPPQYFEEPDGEGPDPGKSDSDSDNCLDNWVKECQDCPCCKGWVYSCQGEACKYMNICYCKAKLDIEQTGSNGKAGKDANK